MSEPVLTLWHYCCRHSARDIGRHGLVRPMVVHPILHRRVAWFTSDRDATRDELGLTLYTIKCDRMERLYRVTDPVGCYLFDDWLRDACERGDCDAGEVNYHMIGPQHRPGVWWVSEHAIPVIAVENALEVEP